MWAAHVYQYNSRLYLFLSYCFIYQIRIYLPYIAFCFINIKLCFCLLSYSFHKIKFQYKQSKHFYLSCIGLVWFSFKWLKIWLHKLKCFFWGIVNGRRIHKKQVQKDVCVLWKQLWPQKSLQWCCSWIGQWTGLLFPYLFFINKFTFLCF